MKQVDIKAEIGRVQAELQGVLQQIGQIEQQAQQLNQRKNPLVQQAIELQGALKCLQHMDGQKPAEEMGGQ